MNYILSCSVEVESQLAYIYIYVVCNKIVVGVMKHGFKTYYYS